MIKDKLSLRIGLDIDGVLADFNEAYLKRFGSFGSEDSITRNVSRVLRFDKDFWVNLSLIRKPDFEIALYCTSRVNKKSWTKEFLHKNGLPTGPVYQVMGYGLSKVPMLKKGKVDLFIDDSVKNFEDLNKQGIPCLLMSTSTNSGYETPYRINSLALDEVYVKYISLISNGY